MEQQVNDHVEFKECYDTFNDWIRNCKIEIQQCSDLHGEREKLKEKETKMKSILKSIPEGEALLKKLIGLSETVNKTTGKEGQDSINQEIKQVKIEWDNIQQLLKETQKLLDKCGHAWSDFMETSQKMKSWEDDFEKRLQAEMEIKKMTPDLLEKCRVCTY